MRNDDLTRVISTFSRMFQDFDNFWDAQTFSSPYTSNYPPCNVWVDEKNYDLTFEIAVAGIPRDQIDITFDGDVMEVQIEESDKKVEGKKCLSHGIKSSRNVSRYVVPASKYDTEKASGVLTDGILTIRIPARESVKPRKLLLE